MPTANTLDAAIAYATQGYSVLACKPGAKEPATKHGFKDATTDPDQIIEWLAENPNANVGIRTGNGLLVIDVDPRNGGTESLARVEAELGPLPRNYVVRTPSSGLHIYLRYTGPKLLNRKDWPGIDVKSDGGYVVAPPSSVNSSSYSILSNGQPQNIPATWLAALQANRPEASGDTSGETMLGNRAAIVWEKLSALPRSIQGQEGRKALIRAGHLILKEGLVGPQGEQLFVRYATERSDPPWEAKGPQGYNRAWREVRKRTEEQDDFGTNDPASQFDVIEDAPAKKSTEPPRVISTHELLTQTPNAEFLVDQVLVKGQPGVIAGPKKTLKTNISIDLGISLATATPFLGHFAVSNSVEVLIVSGESGRATLKETCQRILQARNLTDAPKLFWRELLPRINNDISMQKLIDDIKQTKAKVLILDPTYLCMPGENAGNLMVMGELYRRIGDACLKLGVTLVFLHHVKKSATQAQFDLNDMAFAGLAEFVRQWVGIKRLGTFNKGRSELRLDIGGSVGHSGIYRVVVDEGVLDATITVGRKWDVSVTEIDADAELKELSDKDEIKDVLANGRLTEKGIREATGFNLYKLRRLVSELVADGEIEKFHDLPNEYGLFAKPDDSDVLGELLQ